MFPRIGAQVSISFVTFFDLAPKRGRPVFWGRPLFYAARNSHTSCQNIQDKSCNVLFKPLAVNYSGKKLPLRERSEMGRVTWPTKRSFTAASYNRAGSPSTILYFLE